jgi:hypothetical protein
MSFWRENEGVFKFFKEIPNYNQVFRYKARRNMNAISTKRIGASILSEINFNIFNIQDRRQIKERSLHYLNLKSKE